MLLKLCLTLAGEGRREVAEVWRVSQNRAKWLSQSWIPHQWGISPWTSYHQKLTSWTCSGFTLEGTFLVSEVNTKVRSFYFISILCHRNSLYLLPSGEPVCHLRHQVSPDRKSLYVGEAEESMGARRFSPEVRSHDTSRRSCRRRFYRSFIHFVYQPRIGRLTFPSRHGVGLPSIETVMLL